MPFLPKTSAGSATDEGKIQVVTKAITVAANAAATTLLTVSTQDCIVKSITIYAVTGATADLTNLIITDGTAVVTFIDAVSGVRANLDTADKQVAWTGAAYLPVGETIKIDPTGTGATALDLLAIVEYMAVSDGGVIS